MLIERVSSCRKLFKLFAGARLLILCAFVTASLSAAPAVVSRFTGGDPDEGLDMQGSFIYAVNVGPSGAVGRVGDADFTADNVTGVSITAGNAIATGGWLEAYYGDTENDQNLAVVMNSIRWSDSAGTPNVVTVRLAVTPGSEYKLQLLLGEDCCAGRGFNVIVDGATEVANLMPAVIQMDGTGDFPGTKEISGAVVTKDVPDYAIMAGNPATQIGDRRSEKNA